MHRRRLFLFLICAQLAARSAFAESSSFSPDSSYLSELSQQALGLKLHEDRYWKVLLHYRDGLLGGIRSEVDDSEFFNSKDGKTQPKEELEATLASFFGKTGQKQHPQCRFIDRYLWLKSKLAFDPKRLPEQKCQEFREWKEALAPVSVTLIFSSYYINSPGSMFGHTFLRLNHDRKKTADALLDYGVNYSAVPTTKNAILYVFEGLTGGFLGEFTNTPYYLKVQEYNDTESRDLWEYTLNLSREQIDRMMAHIWSVGHNHMHYYFLTMNCSYMVLTLLDAADPKLHLSEEHTHAWSVIPSNTIRTVTAVPGLVKSLDVRPAIATRILKRREKMSSAQDGIFLSLIRSSPSDVAQTLKSSKALGDRAALPLDAALDYFMFLKFRNKGLDAEQKSAQKEILLARNDVSAPPEEIRFEAEEIERTRPDAGHDTHRFRLGPGYNDVSGAFFSLGFRPSFHDFANEVAGFSPSSEFSILDFDIHLSSEQRFIRLEKLNLLSVGAIVPFERVFMGSSFAYGISIDTLRDISCGDCNEFHGYFGKGLALEFFGKRLLPYFYLSADLTASSALNPGYRLGPSGTAGILFRPAAAFSLHLNTTYMRPLLGAAQDSFISWAESRIGITRNTEVRLKAELFETAKQGSVSLNAYF